MEALRRLAAVAHSSHGEEAAIAWHSLGVALEGRSEAHSRAAIAQSIQALHVHRLGEDDGGAVRAASYSEQRASRWHGVRLGRGSVRAIARQQHRALHELQYPPSCATARLLLVPLWPCCEGLASRAHTVASALAQGAWTNALVLPFLAGCTEPGECALHGLDQTGLLLPVTRQGSHSARTTHPTCALFSL